MLLAFWNSQTIMIPMHLTKSFFKSLLLHQQQKGEKETLKEEIMSTIKEKCELDYGKMSKLNGVVWHFLTI